MVSLSSLRRFLSSLSSDINNNLITLRDSFKSSFVEDLDNLGNNFEVSLLKSSSHWKVFLDDEVPEAQSDINDIYPGKYFVYIYLNNLNKNTIFHISHIEGVNIASLYIKEVDPEYASVVSNYGSTLPKYNLNFSSFPDSYPRVSSSSLSGICNDCSCKVETDCYVYLRTVNSFSNVLSLGKDLVVTKPAGSLYLLAFVSLPNTDTNNSIPVKLSLDFDIIDL